MNDNNSYLLDNLQLSQHTHTHTLTHTEEGLNRDGEWSSGNAVRTFGQHITSETGVFLGAVST